MGTITAKAVIEKAQIILQDATGIRWPDSTELLGWLNDGQREVLILKPNAYVKNEAMSLAAGTKQSIPTNGIQLIDLTRNLGTDGNTPGRAIRIVMREILDAQNPDWHTDTPSQVTKHYTFTPLDPKHFYFWPPATGSTKAEVVYAAVPESIASLNATITLDDIYTNVLVDYILYRAYSKDTDYAADPARAGAHQASYTGALTGKTQGEVIVNPNSSAPANPNVTPTRT